MKEVLISGSLFSLEDGVAYSIAFRVQFIDGHFLTSHPGDLEGWNDSLIGVDWVTID